MPRMRRATAEMGCGVRVHGEATGQGGRVMSRRVKVFKYENMEKVEDGQATFHEWGCDYEEFETGAGNFSTAIIERDDGTVQNVCADLIQFI